MEFRLTYDGPLYAHREDKQAPRRAAQKHEIRQKFHPQLRNLWQRNATLRSLTELGASHPKEARTPIVENGFHWLPLVTQRDQLQCALDILMLRSGEPGDALTDIDNRLKILFDALRMPKSPQELREGKDTRAACPVEGETPFYVLLEDDKLVTKLSVTTDTLLQDVDLPHQHNVRLVLTVTVRPYFVTLDNSAFL